MRSKGYTLVEVLIVISIIVLLLAIALPAFNFITGSHSVGAAYNTMGSFIARARTEAVGLQEIRGVMFYVDPVTHREMLTLVKTTPIQSSDKFEILIDPATGKQVGIENYAYLDLVENADHLPLQKGVSVQVVSDAPSPTTERYYGFNPFAVGGNSTLPIGGVILFGGNGQLIQKQFGFRMVDANGKATAMSTLLMGNSTVSADFIQLDPAPKSTVGFVLFDRTHLDDTRGRQALDADPKFTGVADPAEISTEEKWIADNAMSVLINHYNGTLVKSD